jgi:4,5:9,10-diseco-3-hydroxy-5,9,17-trioxoandrosta-1(10),2-diene-4-oate hydrolase
LFTFESTSRTLHGDDSIHYHVAGEGQALLLLHGSGPGVSAWGNWGGIFEDLSQHYRVIAIDQPGYGKSYRPEVGIDYAAVSIAAAMRVFETEQVTQAHVVGNSLGGMVAVRFALDRPDVVGKVITMGAGGLGVSLFSPSPAEGITRLVAFIHDPTRERLVEWMESMVGNRSILTEDFIEQRWQTATAPGALEYTRDFYTAAMAQGAATPVPPIVNRIGEIDMPVLMLFGRDDRVTPLETALLPMRFLKKGELHVFPGAGHWIMLEQPEAFTGVVLEFLGR